MWNILLFSSRRVPVRPATCLTAIQAYSHMSFKTLIMYVKLRIHIKGHQSTVQLCGHYVHSKQHAPEIGQQRWTIPVLQTFVNSFK